MILKTLIFCIDIFYKNTLMRNAAIFFLFFVSQLAAFGFLLRSFTIAMNGSDSLIAAVSLCFYTVKHTTPNGVLYRAKSCVLPQLSAVHKMIPVSLLTTT